jgi:succinyl-diaminopimelate desuccinylase
MNEEREDSGISPATLAGVPPADRERLVELLAALVRIPSYDPPGDEAAIAAEVAARLEGAGIGTETDELAPRRVNVIGRLRGQGGRPALVFSAHLDTLPPGEGEWSHGTPLSAEMVDGRLYGRGASDMKSGLAAMIDAATAIARSGVRLDGDLVLAFTAGESSNLLGARRLVETGALGGAGALLVSEPTSMDVVVAESAALWLKVTARGRSGHASGGGARNAVTMMAQLLARLHELDLTGKHPLLGRATASVGRIRGGTAVNLVPDRCAAELDLRLLPGHRPEAAEGALRRLAGDGFEIERLDFKPAVETPEDDPFVRLCAAAVARAMGRPPAFRGAAYFSDAAVLAPALGAPRAIVGPGELGGSGSHDEFVEIDRLVAAADAYRDIALGYLGG